MISLVKIPQAVVTWANVNVSHVPEFVIDRPSGSGDFLFLYYTTPIHLRDKTGVSHRKADGCIIYTPGKYQWYSGVDHPFSHHWLHFHGKDGQDLKSFLRSCHLPVDEYFHPGEASFLVPLISQIKAELHSMDNHWQEVVNLLFHQVFLRLSRAWDAARKKRRRQQPVLDKLRAVRHQVHEQIEIRWTLEKMAKIAGLSPSRFSVLYRSFFNITPMEELIVARLKHSCWLLTNSTISVKEAATQSGFENIYYFSRLFHKRIGCPPRDYYKTISKPAKKQSRQKPSLAQKHKTQGDDDRGRNRPHR